MDWFYWSFQGTSSCFEWFCFSMLCVLCFISLLLHWLFTLLSTLSASFALLCFTSWGLKLRLLSLNNIFFWHSQLELCQNIYVRIMYVKQLLEECFVNDSYITLVEYVPVKFYFHIHFFLSYVCMVCIFMMCVYVCPCVGVWLCMYLWACVCDDEHVENRGQPQVLAFLVHHMWEGVSLLFSAAYVRLAGLHASGLSLSTFFLTVGIWDYRYGLYVPGFMWVPGIRTYILKSARQDLFPLSHPLSLYSYIIFSTFTKREKC